MAARLDDLRDILAENPVDIEHLRTFASHGLPDNPGKRSLCWKVRPVWRDIIDGSHQLLLGFLPLDMTSWEAFLAKSRCVPLLWLIGGCMICLDNSIESSLKILSLRDKKQTRRHKQSMLTLLAHCLPRASLRHRIGMITLRRTLCWIRLTKTFVG